MNIFKCVSGRTFPSKAGLNTHCSWPCPKPFQMNIQSTKSYRFIYLVVCVCVGLQVRQASRCTSTYRTARWTRWSRTCLGVLRRTEAWWREQRWSEIYCGKSLYADSPAENCSTHPLCKRHTLLLCSTEETSSIFAFVSQIPTEPLNKLQHLRGFRHICFFFFSFTSSLSCLIFSISQRGGS